MDFIKKYANHWLTKVIILGIIYLAWLLPFVNQSNFFIYELLGQIIITTVACTSLVMLKDVSNVLLIFLLFPFVFSRSFEVDTAPVHLFIMLFALFVAFIVHFIIYKPQIKRPKFFVGLLLIAISMVTGGLLVPAQNKLLTALFMVVIAFGFLGFYVLFASSSEVSFKEFAFMMMLLGSLLMLQYLTWAILNPQHISSKYHTDLGWANNSNNLGMMLLFTYPFIWYLGYCQKGIKRIGYYILSFINLVVIFLSYSRGSIFAILVTGIVMCIYLLINRNTRKTAFHYVTTIIFSFGILMLLCYLINPEFFKAVWASATKINLDNMNGRKPIYEFMLSKFKKEPIFGYGLLYPLSNPMGDEKFETYRYLWGHNTFLQTAYTLGFVGLVAMIWHFIEKYAFCFRKLNLEKAILLFGFLATDIYGFIDVSYFFINFMIVLIVVLVAVDKAFDTERLDVV